MSDPLEWEQPFGSRWTDATANYTSIRNLIHSYSVPHRSNSTSKSCFARRVDSFLPVARRCGLTFPPHAAASNACSTAADAMNEPTPANSSTTLRPRNRRRTRENEDGESPATPQISNSWDGTSRSASASRATSPLPKTHPSQATRLAGDTQRPSSTNNATRVSSFLGPQTSTASFAGLWESSWASLQGIASNLIGNDSSRTSTPNRSPTRRRRPFESSSGIRNTSAPPAQWGPSGNADKRIAAGTKEDRRAQVQAKKREALLAANGHTTADSLGHYKRRDSDDQGQRTGENEDREALVYLHRVKPQDTMAGVTIRYACQPTIFRKVNRLWPNDSIQIRKVVVLPIDACGVRGRKVSKPPEESSTDTKADDNTIEEVTHTTKTLNSSLKPTNDASGIPAIQTPLSSIPTSPSISFSLSSPDEPPWTHDSWVEIDGFSEPIEIARLSRKALGFFPRSRRKSLSFSDLETPSASFDLPRPSYQSTGGSPGRRASIRGSKSRSSSTSQFAKSLYGPGGVGTMSSNVRSPGPAQDGLNKMFAAHLPNLAPKSSFESLRSASSHGNIGVSSSGGIENIGGAIEGWVRKVATKASSSVQPSNQSGMGYRKGDLIELSEGAFEIGTDDDDNDTKKDSSKQHQGSDQGRVNAITGWTSEQQEQMLHDRFPPRGRVFADNSRRGGSR